MREPLSEAQITTAVNWWKGALGHPKYDALGGQRDRPMEAAQVMMAAFGARLTPEQIDCFGDHLRVVLSDQCDHTWAPNWGDDQNQRPIQRDRVLSVDYDPDLVLRHCGEIAEFPRAFFWPCKTMMWLTDGGVKVRYGYGAPIQELVAGSGPGESPT